MVLVLVQVQEREREQELAPVPVVKAAVQSSAAVQRMLLRRLGWILPRLIGLLRLLLPLLQPS